MRRVLAASVLVVAGLCGASAQAQEVGQPSYFEKAMPAPAKAFEINFASAYNQGWGNLTDNQSIAGRTFGGRQVQDVAGAGLQFELDLGWRATPSLAVGVYGTIAGYTNQTPVNGTNFRSLTTGIQGQWFMRPYHSFNPWVTLGTAYRASWLVPEIGGNTSRHGWEVARVQIGTDFRLAPAISIAPYVAGDLNLMFSENPPFGESRSLDGTPTYATFTAGILGRFDVGAQYVTPGGAVAHR
jgi:hypothetical protein